MASSTDDPTESASLSGEVTGDGNAHMPVDTDSADELNAADQGSPPENGSEPFADAAISVNSVHAEDDRTSLKEPADAEDLPDPMVSERTEEVPALLEKIAVSQLEEPETASTMDSVQDKPDDQPIPAATVQPGNSPADHPAGATELKIILESLQESLDNTQNISSKMDAVSNDTARLVNQVNNISSICELLTTEMESVSSGTHTKNILSKTFLTISSIIIALLLIFQVYIFTSLIKIQRIQNAAGTSVLENISQLNKQMAAYNSNLTKALENPVQQGQAQLNPAAPEKAGHDDPGNIGTGSSNAMAVLEKMNKLRNGLPERKLIRKETGDWFIFNKKNEECIADAEAIDVLNQAYKKIGRSLSPAIPMPSHKAICILKPDGKGGTEVVMSKNFLP